MQIEWKRRLETAGIILGVYLGFRFVLPAAFPFLAAWVIAGMLYPAAVRIEKRFHIKRTISGTLLLGFLLGAAGLLLFYGCREIMQQGRLIVERISALAVWGNTLLNRCCLKMETLTGIEAAKSKTFLVTQGIKWQDKIMEALGSKAGKSLWSFAKGSIVCFSSVVLTGILSLLILSDMENLQRKIRGTGWLKGTRHVLSRLGETVLAYLKAQFLIILLVSAICAAGFWMLGSPYFLILGILLGFLDALPVIGTGTFLYPAAVFFLLQGRGGAAVICVILDLITSFLREILEPRLIGQKLGVSPILILAAVYGGVFLFGVWGVLLGPLFCATVYQIGKELDVWD
jgi:sporulation integral membrane protein YtvI